MGVKTSILLVEDNPQDIAVITSALEQEYTIFVAKSSLDVGDIIEKEDIQLILMDINIPGINGLELTKLLKSRDDTEKIPIIFVTAYQNSENEIAALDAGAYDFISKPINPVILKKRVHVQRQLDLALREAHQRAELLQENLKLHELVDSMSYHDMKNLLIPLMNLPDLMSLKVREFPSLGEEFTSYLEKMLSDMRNASYRVLDMVNRTHDLYLMENGRYELCREQVNCSKLLYEVSGTLRTLLQKKGVSIAITIDNRPTSSFESFFIEGEEYLFHNIFMNLVKNAVEASGQGDEISINMDRTRKEISFHNSQPVPEEIHKSFFKKFTTFGKQSGTGLGTYIVKVMVELMKGQVSLVSCEKEGTTVTLSFLSS